MSDISPQRSIGTVLVPPLSELLVYAAYLLWDHPECTFYPHDGLVSKDRWNSNPLSDKVDCIHKIMSKKRTRSPPAPSPTQIFKSSTIEDRSSTFIAVFSPTYAPEALQSLSEFKDASHRMTAWRKPSTQRSLNNAKSIFETGHDDDGENYGGKTLEKILIAKDVVGAVMVARWYGGVMLGPVRFDHMKDVADNAIARWAQEGERAAKRVKTERERQQLITEVLPQRDQSIEVLRGLLVEKKGKTGKKTLGSRTEPCSGQTDASPSPSPSSAKTPDYSVMDLHVLERLEQVRDKTIGWILAQIEEAEKAHRDAPEVEQAVIEKAHDQHAAPGADEPAVEGIDDG